MEELDPRWPASGETLQDLDWEPGSGGICGGCSLERRTSHLSLLSPPNPDSSFLASTQPFARLTLTDEPLPAFSSLTSPPPGSGSAPAFSPRPCKGTRVTLTQPGEAGKAPT